MADRIQPRLPAPRRGVPVVIRRRSPGGDGGDPGPPPGAPFDDQTPREVSGHTNNRLATSAGQRELTVHPAQGVVPVQYGGPLRVGGFPIFYKRVGSTVWIDFAICEGPVESISNFRWLEKTAANLSIVTETHLGVAGDTTSTLISATEPTYDIPEYIAHIACRFKNPTQLQGAYNPFDFSCSVEGRTLFNPSTLATAFSGSPVAAAFDALTNDRYSIGTDVGRMNSTDWGSAEDYASTEIETDLKRWELALRIDQQDILKSWLDVLLSYCHGHPRWISGVWGIYLERPRALAVDNESNVIEFDDVTPEAANVEGEITFAQKGAQEIPNVVTVEYTDVQTVGGIQKFQTGTVQIPAPADLDPSVEWIEDRISMLGIMSNERARRWATLNYNVKHLDKDITIPAWENAWLVVNGDRIRGRSPVLIDDDETPPNASAIQGAEELVVTGVTLADHPVVRCGLYRDATYGDAIDTSGPPQPPFEPPDPDDDPDCPTDLDAPNSDPAQYGLVEFTPPDDDTNIRRYRVEDLYSGSPIVAGYFNPPSDPPISPDGKYRKTFPTLVHVDDTGVHLHVRVVSETYADNESSGCADTSWDVSGGLGTLIESAAYVFEAEDIASTSYDWVNYSKVIAVTKQMSTTVVDPINDFFVVPSTNAQGVICPKMDGWFLTQASGRWQANADSNFRGMILVFLGLAGNVGLHTLSLTVDASGTGFLSGEELTFTGGTLASGGFHGAGVIVASGGSITGIVLTEPLIGWSVAPTIGVDTVSGAGGTITAHLPAAFEISDINFDCTVDAAGSAKGSLWDEDLRAAINSSGVPTSNKAGIYMSMHRGDGLLVGVQQGSGATLDILDESPTDTLLYGRRPRISIIHIPPATPLAEQFATCPPPE